MKHICILKVIFILLTFIWRKGKENKNDVNEETQYTEGDRWNEIKTRPSLQY